MKPVPKAYRLDPVDDDEECLCEKCWKEFEMKDLHSFRYMDVDDVDEEQYCDKCCLIKTDNCCNHHPEHTRIYHNERL